MSEHGFTRTSCACDADVANCTADGERRGRRGFLIPSDIPKIADSLVESGRTADQHGIWPLLRKSPGAVLGDSQTGALYRIGTIAPRRQGDGRCVFLSAENRCTIHAVAPFGCAYFDEHMTDGQHHQRSLWAHTTIARSRLYAAVRATLKEWASS